MHPGLIGQRRGVASLARLTEHLNFFASQSPVQIGVEIQTATATMVAQARSTFHPRWKRRWERVIPSSTLPSPTATAENRPVTHKAR